MRVLGLTGGIGSGKSTVARMLARRGARVVDADQLAREVVAPGSPALALIVQRFGAGVVTPEGALDRAGLGRRVFADPTARAALNAIVHPAVAERAQAAFRRAEEEGAALVIYDVPLLYENGLEGMFAGVVVVAASDEARRARIRARDGLDDEEISRRMAAQLPLAEKAARATWVIHNDGTLASTEAQVDALWRELSTP